MVTYQVSLDNPPTSPATSPNLLCAFFLNVNNHDHSGAQSPQMIKSVCATIRYASPHYPRAYGTLGTRGKHVFMLSRNEFLHTFYFRKYFRDK